MATKQKKRSLQKVLPIVRDAMKDHKQETGESADLAAVVKATGSTFKSEQDCGTWLAGAVTRMDDSENRRHGTPLHNGAKYILGVLKAATGDDSKFAVSGGNSFDFDEESL